jgi:LCP family protein required for cell wall assembly
MRGAAPWERAVTHGSHANDSGTDEPSAPPTGSHTDGVTVADLIAKVVGTAPVDRSTDRPRHRTDEAPPTEPPPVDAEPVADYPDYPEFAEYSAFDPATDILPAVSAQADDLPVLSETPRPAHVENGRQRTASPSRRGMHSAMIVGRVAAALIAVLALALTGAAWQWQSVKNGNLNRVSALDPNSRDILDPNAQFGDENFLIVGTDTRIGVNSDMGAGTIDDAAGARSDTIMLVNIPADRKRVVAVSFPRDLAITPIKCEPWDPQTLQYGPITDPDSPMYGLDEAYTETKLNSAYAVGGPKCLVKVIQKMSGLSVNRFMAVDFAGFSKMVDALGGVEVCTTTPLEDYELGTVLANAGPQLIDGHTALQYVRARQVVTETNGDYGRIKRQQLFLSSLLRSLISKDTFFSLSKLNNVVNMFINDSYVDNIDTKDLVDLGQSIQGVNAGRITFLTVPTVGYADEYGNETPREDDLRALFDAIIDDEPLPEEKNADNTPVPQAPDAMSESESGSSPSESTPAPADPTGGQVVDAVTTDPSDVTVRVSNSTGESGLAATAASDLQEHGFVVTDPDDYPGPLSSTTVFYSSGNEQAAATVASAFATHTIEQVSGMGDEVRVVLGSDFHSVGAPSPSGSPVQVQVVKGTSSEPTHLPEDLTVTNAADTTCE